MKGHYTPSGVRMSCQVSFVCFRFSSSFRQLRHLFCWLFSISLSHMFPSQVSPSKLHREDSCKPTTEGRTHTHRICNSCANHMRGRGALRMDVARLQKRRPWRALEKCLANESWNESEEERVQYFQFAFFFFPFTFSLSVFFCSYLLSFPYFSSYV